MRIRRVLESISEAVAPHVCPMCEGGTGVLYDATTGVVTRCPACAGTGRVSTPVQEAGDPDMTAAHPAHHPTRAR